MLSLHNIVQVFVLLVNGLSFLGTPLMSGSGSFSTYSFNLVHGINNGKHMFTNMILSYSGHVLVQHVSWWYLGVHECELGMYFK